MLLISRWLSRSIAAGLPLLIRGDGGARSSAGDRHRHLRLEARAERARPVFGKAFDGAVWIARAAACPAVPQARIVWNTLRRATRPRLVDDGRSASTSRRRACDPAEIRASRPSQSRRTTRSSSTQFGEVAKARLQLGEPVRHQSLDAAAWGAATVTLRQDRGQIVEREANSQCSTHQAYPLDRLG